VIEPKISRLPAVTLALIAPVLTELLSGNVPAQRFFLPWVYGALILVYGLPALMVRELYIAWNLGLPGLFLMGLAYGIFNEGVCAKTLLLAEHVPIDAFDHYTWLGVNFPWAALIVPWHAAQAVIFPIALVTYWFPDAARTSWISARVFRGGGILLAAGGALIHLTNKKPATPPVYLLFFAAVMGALVYWSKRTGRSEAFLGAGGTGALPAALAGISFYPALVMGLSICAGMKLPGVVICLGAVLLVGFYWRWLARRGWLMLTPFVLFAMGDCFSGALLTGLFQWKGSGGGVVTSGVLAGFFATQIFVILRKPVD
jgi:hypothetical protein